MVTIFPKKRNKKKYRKIPVKPDYFFETFFTCEKPAEYFVTSMTKIFQIVFAQSLSSIAQPALYITKWLRNCQELFLLAGLHHP
jgi:hypothetical protein